MTAPVIDLSMSYISANDLSHDSRHVCVYICSESRRTYPVLHICKFQFEDQISCTLILTEKETFLTLYVKPNTYSVHF
jgi:hypothetical protein